MKKKIQKSLLIFFALFISVSGVVSAHQPRLVGNEKVIITDPEISKAYYGKLEGQPQIFVLSAIEPFDLYVNILVPDIKDQKKDVSVVILKNGKELAVLDGMNFEWQEFFEPFGHDDYFMGPEYKARAERGEYEIRVWSSHNDSKYALAVGEIEAFDQKAGLEAMKLIPQLKSDFFGKSPIGFIFSPFGWGLILAMYALAFVAGFIVRVFTKQISKSSPSRANKNIGKTDRLIRVIIALALLFWAMSTTWSPIIILLSGFAMFEAIFSWCGFYAFMGKNTC